MNSRPRIGATLWLIIRHEARILLAERTLPLACLLLALMIGYGLAVGLRQDTVRGDMIVEVHEHEQQSLKSNLEKVRSVPSGREALVPFENPANPVALAGKLSGRYATIPNRPLAATAIGQSDMMPNYYHVSYLSKVQFMYDSEIENPWNLLSGHFDLAFVIVFVLPLIIIGLGYNLLSGERERGTLRMLCSQPLTVSTLLAGKIIVRIVALLAVAIVLPISILLVLRPDTRGSEQLILMLSWSALVAAYSSFWFALAAVVNVFGRSSSSNALALIATWTLLVLIIPVLTNLFIAVVSPAPSRTALASLTRVVTGESLLEYERLYSADYRYAADPEALQVKDGKIEVPARMLAFFLAKQRVDERIEPLLKGFDEQLLAQQKIVDRMSFLSPAILVNEAMSAIAGTDSRRFAAFKGQTERFHDGWREYFAPRIRESRAMSPEDVSTLPQWQWVELSEGEIRQSVWTRIALTLALAMAAGVIAFANASRSPIVE
ncbi:DUF3526 domain-containing protein [Bradyrhizobium sp. 200]|uniref:DUF3526 domain-containing protein n=1 Tax=Bradyrhizobium sp. 200 TaxID=2782665 RepID=UPI001FFEDB93|nr:DUF3526 domain-containing protein [Bradyrhizobium sp. 200]UPJ46755.1 DUF3526 domain-containing protein [Bradyrhizobium sp. 200]